MRENAGLVLIGFFCVYPMIFAAIGFAVGRYRLKLRSPIAIDRSMQVTPAESKSLLRRVHERKEDRIGFGTDR